MPLPSRTSAITRSRHGPAPPAHRYQVGELVALSRGFGYAPKAGAVYEVTQLLPQDRTQFHYRIRSTAEAFSRVAAENELTPRPLPRDPAI